MAVMYKCPALGYGLPPRVCFVMVYALLPAQRCTLLLLLVFSLLRGLSASRPWACLCLSLLRTWFTVSGHTSAWQLCPLQTDMPSFSGVGCTADMHSHFQSFYSRLLSADAHSHRPLSSGCPVRLPWCRPLRGPWLVS